MIHEIQGDAVNLLKIGLIDGLAHCANAQGVMGAGIAKQIAKEYPKVLTEYKQDLNNWYYQGKERSFEKMLGKVSELSNPYIFSIIGQADVGTDKRQVNYGAIAAGLSQIIATHVNENKFKLGIPKYMGCGLAGGDWEIMSEIIYGMFRHVHNIDLYIIEYKE